MKICLSNTKQHGTNYTWVNNLSMLNDVVLDSEGTDILCDNFISCFSFEEIPELLKVITTKLRLNGKFTIADVDSSILCRRAYNQELENKDINICLFHEQKRKSLTSLEELIKIIPKNLTIESKSYDHQTCRFIVVARRKF